MVAERDVHTDAIPPSLAERPMEPHLRPNPLCLLSMTLNVSGANTMTGFHLMGRPLLLGRVGSSCASAALFILMLAFFLPAFSPVATAGAQERIIVSGASGNIGSLVVDQLLERGVDPRDLILVSRTPEDLTEYERLGASTRFGDFARPESLPAAYEGGSRILLISINPHPERVQLHRNAIDAAVRAGVRHIVYTSSVDVANPVSNSAFEHRQTEEYIQQQPGITWTMLRNQLYADGIVGQAARMVAAGRAVINPDWVATAFVTREDCAAAATAVLLDPARHANAAYDITGSDLVGRREIALLASELSGTRIELVEGEVGVPQAQGPMVGFASFQLRSGDVERLTGRPPVTIRQLLEANLEALVGSRR
jgi:NAD(P)H dehydrogenase (quinone)